MSNIPYDPDTNIYTLGECEVLIKGSDGITIRGTATAKFEHIVETENTVNEWLAISETIVRSNCYILTLNFEEEKLQIGEEKPENPKPIKPIKNRKRCIRK